MINHYKILGIDQSADSKKIKETTKILFNKIDASNNTDEKKSKMKKSIYESYKFLTDYHSRKSLDDYLDSMNNQYKVINRNEFNPFTEFDNLNNVFSSFTPIHSGSFRSFVNNIEKSVKNENINSSSNSNNKSSQNNYYMKSYSSKVFPDKNGNYIQEVVEKTNNNGKKEEKKYKNTIKKNNNKLEPINKLLKWENK